jgi:DNA polymerase
VARLGGQAMKLFCDLEAFSDVTIKHGTHRYAERAEVMLFAWAIDDEPAAVWDVTTGAPIPKRLAAALADESVQVYAHNSGFDRTVLRHAMPDICPPLYRWRDTMVQAYAHALPGKLGDLCEILNVPSEKAKDKEGKKFIRLFCMPPAANVKRPRATRLTHPEEWARFVTYAGLDIEAMREIHKRMPMWNYQGEELALWHLDQTINDRGVAIDLELAEAAVAAVEIEKKVLARRARVLTDEEVQSTTQRDALLGHVLAEYGVALPNMQSATLERRIADPDLPAGLRELLQIRLQASTTSTSKYKTLITGTSSDGRLRGLLQFDGASRTGRWAGRLFQPQNLKRSTMEHEAIEDAIEVFKAGAADLMLENVMDTVSNCTRGCIIAPPGRKLVVTDLSNIEGRVQAWLASEEWKLHAFSDFDAGEGPDLYKLAYSKSFGVAPEDVSKPQRQIGKVMELALSYSGGVGAFATFAAAYGINLEELAGQAARSIPPEVWGQANIMLAWHRDKLRDPPPDMGMSDPAWLTCESFKLAWRSAHPQIVSLWAELEENVRAAIAKPGNTFRCRMLKIRRDGSWLRIVLPSGRAICYPSPEIDDEGRVSYMGVDQYTRRWQRLTTYSGKIFENCAQATARDVMAHNMQPIEDAGYKIVLTVHDEIVTETPDAPEYNDAALSALLSAVPPWAQGMPLASAGFEAYRYRKE